jgi:hypothetical protein
MTPTGTPRSEKLFHVPTRHDGWKDVAVVAFLVVLLGAFVAQLATPWSPDRAASELRARAACVADRAAC